MQEGRRSAFKILTGKSTERIHLGRKWEDNFRMGLKEIGINTRNWVALVQDWGYCRALVNAALNLLVP